MVKIDLLTFYKLDSDFYFDILTVETLDTISSLFSIGYINGYFKLDVLFYKGFINWLEKKKDH